MKYKVELSKSEIDTIINALDYFTDGIRATLLKLKVSKQEYDKLMSELLANQLQRDFMLLLSRIEQEEENQSMYNIY